MGRLDGKIALITGAGEGMGRAAAILFAREGAKVAVLDISSSRAEETSSHIQEQGGIAIAIQADVSLGGDCSGAVERAIREYGALHVLYNNAGVWIPGDNAVTELDLAAWDRTIAVNLTGVMLMCRFAIPHLIQAGGGSVINTSSPVAFRPEPVYDAYTASKGGVTSLTLSIAQYYGPQGVRANVLAPGSILTAMTREAFADERYRAAAEKMTILGRIGQPEDVAYAALFLASDESRFVTGSVQWVDGGWMLGPRQDAFPVT
jgi:NAD(P)-dependent dehydrogenase (short-subunit alcohol dehydrogenase family)